eukprot:898367-Prymnesium_polylepis.1
MRQSGSLGAASRKTWQPSWATLTRWVARRGSAVLWAARVRERSRSCWPNAVNRRCAPRMR